MLYMFFTRLFLYILAAVIPVIHPAIVVAYDSVTGATFLFLVPLEMTIAYFVRPPRVNRLVTWVVPAVAFVLTYALYMNQANSWSLMIPAAIGSYLLTRMVFARLHIATGIAVVETFLLGFVYYKVLSYARSSEELASSYQEYTSVIFFVTIVAFFLHSLVLYLSAFPDRSTGRKRKELLYFGAIAIPLAAILIFFLPPDFVKHTIALNDLGKEAPTNPRQLGGDNQTDGGSSSPPPNKRNGKPLGDRSEKYPSELQGQNQTLPPSSGGSGGGSRGQEGQQGGSGGGSSSQGSGEGEGSRSQEGQGNGSGTNNKVEGVPADQWDQFNQSGGGKGKQKAVMVLASEIDPIYAALQYEGTFDSGKGFVPNEENPLNELATRRLMETWETSERVYDLKRNPVDVFYLSTIDERVVAYMPLRIQPTVRDVRYHPFDLSYTAKSGISVSNPEDWDRIRELTDWEKQDLEFYLQIPEDVDTSRVQTYVNRIVKGKKGYFNRIDSILKSFEKHQYEMGREDTMSYSRMEEFLFEKKSGDCTEFAHTIALMMRMAGYPSRVVTGYIASRDLQTPAHLRGLHELRKNIEPLKEYPLETMYLVTTSHRHDWIQVYFPGYGWIDVETTSYAIPPEAENDPNNMDVIIPLIEEESILPEKHFQVPWRLLLIVTGVTGALIVFGLYTFRYGREFFLYLQTKSKHEKKALRALYKLFFIRLASRGYPLKEPHRTVKEYATAQPELEQFASVYSMLRFREVYASGEKEIAWNELRTTFRQAMKDTKRSGIIAFFKRIFSLRGLYY